MSLLFLVMNESFTVESCQGLKTEISVFQHSEHQNNFSHRIPFFLTQADELFHKKVKL